MINSYKRLKRLTAASSCAVILCFGIGEKALASSDLQFTSSNQRNSKIEFNSSALDNKKTKSKENSNKKQNSSKDQDSSKDQNSSKGQNSKKNKESKFFKMCKWIEIQGQLLSELNNSYVDSLPIDRIETAGINAMLENLDPYTMYIPEEENDNFEMMLSKTYGGIGAIIYKPKKSDNVIINEPYIGSPAYKNGIKCGDEIISINGKSVKGMETKDASDNMKGRPGTDVTFMLKKLRGGEGYNAGDTVKVVVKRERIHLPDVEYAGMLDDTTGYILQTGFTENVAEHIKQNFLDLKKQGMKRFVLDLRNNGGGIMQEAIKIVSLFVPKGSLVVSAKGNDGKSIEYKTTREPLDDKMPIIVLVNSGSASSSEIVAGALQDLDRATIMGKRTYGKGLIQSIRTLPFNGQLKVTTGKYYTPSGRCVQAIDYSHRNSDGSVGHIPDSLTKEFKTSKGRIVKDGGGITPDVTLKSPKYSRITVSLLINGLIDQYTLKFVREHEKIAPLKDFKLSDKEYDKFVNFACNKKFDYRSQAQALYDKMKEELKSEGLYKNMETELKQLDKAIDLDKKTLLELKKDEIRPILEEEIATRYYYQQAGVQVRLRYDDQLKKALSYKL